MIRVATTEYKALTVVNLPFIEERFFPGEMIPHDRFEAMAEEAAAVIDDRTDRDPDASPVWTADEHVAELLAWGSISEDADAELHPDHLPVNPNDFTVATAVARVKAMVDEMEAAGVEIPAKMREFANMSDAQVEEADANRRMVSTTEGGEVRGGSENATT
jgi:hypothetical protein